MPKSIVFDSFVQGLIPLIRNAFVFHSAYLKQSAAEILSINQDSFASNKTIVVEVLPAYINQQNTVCDKEIETAGLHPCYAFLLVCRSDGNIRLPIIFGNISKHYWLLRDWLNFIVQIKGTELKNAITH